MSDDISLDVIKKTQISLGEFVKKPPLSEKLLRKPPFRYLHDIISAVIKNTGFFNGLFTEKELVSENVKEREDKIQFLQKIINVVNIVTNTETTARASRIIAGHEPEKTNELLQKIGEAIKQNLNSDEAVQIILNGSKPPSTRKNDKVVKNNKQDIKKNIPIKAERNGKLKENNNRSKEPKKTELNNKEIKKTTGSKKPEKITNVEGKSLKIKSTKEKTNVIPKNIEENGSRLSFDNTKSEDVDLTINDTSSVEEPKRILADESKIISKDEGEDHAKNESIELKNAIVPNKEHQNGEIHINHIDKNESQVSIKQEEQVKPAKSANKIRSEKRHSIDNQSKHSAEKLDKNKIEKQDSKENAKSKVEKENFNDEKRISGIRQEELKEKKQVENIEEKERFVSSKIVNEENSKVRPRTSLRPPSVRPSSSRPGAPRFKEANIDTIIATNLPKEKVKIIVEDYDKKQEADESTIIIETLPIDNAINDDFEKIHSNSAGNKGHLVEQILATQKELTGNAPKVDIEWEWGTRQEREASHKEVEIIKTGLQSLSRVANPLGKLVEHIQEDAEIMRQELLQWREVRKKSLDMLNQQESLTEKSCQPLETKLKNLENNIFEQLEMINAIKSNISRNNQKIRNLTNGNLTTY